MSSETVLKQAQALLNAPAPVSESDIRRLVHLLLEKGEDEVVFFILQLIQRVQELAKNQSVSPPPSTPSGMIPPYQKASAQTGAKKRKKKAGGQPGHPGACRPQPEKIDRREELRLDRCPDCGGSLQPCEGKTSLRSRIVEDIPAAIKPEVTEYILHRSYCPHCRKLVEPKVEAALPNARIGHHLVALTAIWHFGMGLPTAQILETLNYHLHFPLSKGGLIEKWHTLRIILLGWYEVLVAEIQVSAVLHADETGWRVTGETHWLWCFANEPTTVYMVDRSRGSPALKQMFKEEFQGILVTDFWAAYDSILGGEHQCSC